jgi:uncharacterized Zn finger protein
MMCPNCGGKNVHKTKDKSGERIKQKRSKLMTCPDCGYTFRLVEIIKDRKKNESSNNLSGS